MRIKPSISLSSRVARALWYSHQRAYPNVPTRLWEGASGFEQNAWTAEADAFMKEMAKLDVAITLNPEMQKG